MLISWSYLWGRTQYFSLYSPTCLIVPLPDCSRFWSQLELFFAQQQGIILDELISFVPWSKEWSVASIHTGYVQCRFFRAQMSILCLRILLWIIIFFSFKISVCIGLAAVVVTMNSSKTTSSYLLCFSEYNTIPIAGWIFLSSLSLLKKWCAWETPSKIQSTISLFKHRNHGLIH